MEKKTFKFEIKELQEDGTFEGYAAIFNNIDSYGDIIEKGAFKKTLSEHAEFPILWSHDPRDPIGVVSAEEDTHGLKVKGKLALGVQRAREIYELMKMKAVKGLSIGYDTIQKLIDEVGRHLKEVKLWEVSPCTFQANELAEVTAVKEMESKPYPNEHACRLREPGEFQADSFRRITREHEGKKYSVIMGRLKNETTMTEQAYRYAKDIWTDTEGRAHCKAHDGNFEAAQKCDECEVTLEMILDDIELFEAKSLTADQKIQCRKIAEKIKALVAAEPPPGTPVVQEPQVGDDKSNAHLSGILEEFQKLQILIGG